jgi:integrase
MSVKAYQTKEGVTLFSVYVNVTSKRNRKLRIQKNKEGIKTEREAKNIEKKFIDEAKREMGKLDGYGLLWSDVVTRFENNIPQGFSGISEGTAVDYLSCARTWTSSWMMMVAKEITPSDARDVFEQMNEDGAASTYQDKVKKAIKAIYSWGINNGLIVDGINPMTGIKIKKGESKPPLILTCQEYELLLQKAKERNIEWYPVWYMALFTGMRCGELKALKVSQIDWERNCIKVDCSINSKIES